MRFKKMLSESSSDVEFEQTLQAFADLVGKNGKYSHKATAMHLAKAYGYKESKADINVKQIMDDLEDWNYHTEHAILQALVKGKKKDADILVLMAQAQEKAGHLPPDLGVLRHFMTSDRKRFMDYWERIGKDMYGEMKLTSEVLNIVKKMPKKDAEQFLGLFGM